MADLPGRSDYQEDDRARADDDEGWGSPLPAEYGSLRAVRPRPPEPEAPQPERRPARERSWLDPDRGPMASLLRRIQGDTSNGGPVAASAGAGSAPAMPSRIERSRSAGRGTRWERPDLLHRVRSAPAAAPGSVTPTAAPPGSVTPTAAPPGSVTPTAAPAPSPAPPAGDPSAAAAAPPVTGPPGVAHYAGDQFAPAGESPASADPTAYAAAAAGTVPEAVGTAPEATEPSPEAAHSWYSSPAGYQRTSAPATAPATAPPAGAPPVPALPGPGSPAGAPDLAISGRNRRRSARRPARVRSRATIRHLDITTVIRVSLMFWLVVLLAMITASVFLWSFADAFGSLPSIEKSVRTLFSLKTFKLHPTTVAFYTGLAGVVLCVAGTIANVIGALIYNLIADVVGGVRVELESFSRE